MQPITDPQIRPLIERLRRRRSKNPELLAYMDGRRWFELRSDAVNAYVKEATGGDFSAKVFRTWNATMLAGVALASMKPARDTESARERTINEAVKGVAAFLGNTPAVCRQSYIDPRVFDHFRGGATIAPFLKRAVRAEDAYEPRVQRTIERAVVRLIED